MAETKTFHLPDLGEGLPDATIIEWHVALGDAIKLDAPLLTVETAKAMVDVPSPYTGILTRRHGEAGSVVVTGHPLAEFELDPNARQRAEAQPTGHHHAPATEAPRADQGSVVGAMVAGDQVHVEQTLSRDGVKAVPAVRALAHKLRVDLQQVMPSGADGVITMDDVKLAAAIGCARLPSEAPRPQGRPATEIAPPVAAPSVEIPPQRAPLSQAGKPIRTAPPSQPTPGQPEPLRGVHRNMARVMADAHAQVVLTTLVDDADLHAWIGKQDITARLVRAVVAACRIAPALNAWFDGKELTRTLHPHVDLGIAMDSADGLFVPTLRNADMLDAASIREGINRLRSQVEDRSIAPSELTGSTISLSNFGTIAGRYGTPIVVPPAVAIIGAGRLSHDVVAVMGGIEVHRRLPLSLSFDHRAVTGGDAARFLKAMLDDLALPH
ncbi:dihydrolipoamide acetyltransferase family protein [Frateuria aurantia]|uniref:Dihydrolipoamide acetyltransferase component of pyruvate dehydrogenase complex n=1 Tax=Frateuria aurantia (strain ATCC 33424 / DSM 6220 / KCTC 2777 / LMG 1558 / NBRC 3245 / NCIMB 13370) TaxID=767434 RepID=H8L405_FRAAD|nr:dihydrolipoamide acetyltransferase family protein [Frateuria aurantia]AFC85599.1 pyruvate/2-oxoglutarate dehydrogenase complex, dihydrolipoamide acyltransferase component [Frateuria aurantia DSM 6220]